MSLNSAVNADRVQIAFFGKRNVGKSSLVNAVTGQNLSVVSDKPGTTTDPVKKAMELLPIGPVLIVDTPGFDDTEEGIGSLRVEKTMEALQSCSIAVMVLDSTTEVTKAEIDFIEVIKQSCKPYLLVYSKSDKSGMSDFKDDKCIFVSAKDGINIDELKNRIAALGQGAVNNKTILVHLLEKGDRVVLVVPIDDAAPKGRLILPQQQVMRELLDFHFIFSVCRPEELGDILSAEKVDMVVTDSNVFKEISSVVPDSIPLTSFSILFAEYKGSLELMKSGIEKLDNLKEGDTVLIAEGCTHHRQCGDIGSVKIPSLIKENAGCDLNFEFTSGGTFSSDLSRYALVVHCGGCMLNKEQMMYRLKSAKEQGVPVINYGILLAKFGGVLDRCVYKKEDVLSTKNSTKVPKTVQTVKSDKNCTLLNEFSDSDDISYTEEIKNNYINGMYDGWKVIPQDILFMFTDGACSGNPGVGGYGTVIRYGENVKELSGGEQSTTNNRMELTAVIKGFEALKKPCKVILVTDSKYVADSLLKGWVFNWQAKGWVKTKSAPVPNKELWQQLLSLISIHTVSVVWVKGHAGHPENERCDLLATSAIKKIKSEVML